MQAEKPVKEEVNETPEKKEEGKEEQKDPKKPKKRNQKKGQKNENKPQRAPRKRKYVYEEPENWREALEKEVTLETKPPKLRKKEDLMKRPQREDLTKKLEKKNKQINKMRKEIDELYKEKDRIRNEEWKKSNEGFALFKKLKEAKEEAFENLKNKREELKWKQLKEQKMKKRDRLRQIMDKSPFKGIAKNTAQATKHIEKLKMDFRDMKKTAKEEKALTEKIKKFEKGLGVFEKVDLLQKKLDELNEKMNAAKEQIAPLEKIFDKAKKEFNANNEEFKKKKESEKEKQKDTEPEKGEKKKRVETPAEKEIVKKVQKVRDNIDKVKKEKDEVFDEFDKLMVEYRKDHFEFARENYINRLLKKLKHEENQRKWEENKAKQEEERKQRLKDARKEIFTVELEKINTVNGALQLLKLDKDRGDVMNTQGKNSVEGKPTDMGDIDLEAENLQLIVSKKKQNYMPVSKKKKKRNKQKNKVNLAMMGKMNEKKSLVPVDVAVILKDMKIEAPSELSQVEDTIRAISAKRDEYLKLRERYVNEEVFEGEEAEMVNKGEKLLKSGEDWEGEDEIRETKDKKKKKAPKKKAKVVEENGEDFLKSMFQLLDLKRLQSYAKGMVDFHMIKDLVPLLSESFFLGKFGREVRMSYTQAVILLAMGLQHREIEDIAEEAGIDISHSLALFNKSIRKLAAAIKKAKYK